MTKGTDKDRDDGNDVIEQMNRIRRLDIQKHELFIELTKEDIKYKKQLILNEQQRFEHLKKQVRREELSIDIHNKKLDAIQLSIDTFCEKMEKKLDIAINEIDNELDDCNLGGHVKPSI